MTSVSERGLMKSRASCSQEFRTAAGIRPTMEFVVL
jgi:hypothetical protein